MILNEHEHRQVPVVPDTDHWQEVLQENGRALYYDARSQQGNGSPRRRARLTQLPDGDRVKIEIRLTLVLPIDRVGNKLGVSGFRQASWYAPRSAQTARNERRSSI
ncbi:hypothetical protein KDH_80260 [Dictyobacter sp. S3.2.2.5]|uniref:Uncharacterized protein n=1 Tax=Dictyobacter halimunensis TaxID=3026934 RepID=A0ABQ6G524_9CHLR|nr:hypothetical protein KDH_80260 [Dictyobacter sp. S3.2.2.5]